jgi:hypothetical protein
MKYLWRGSRKQGDKSIPTEFPAPVLHYHHTHRGEPAAALVTLPPPPRRQSSAGHGSFNIR